MLISDEFFKNLDLNNPDNLVFKTALTHCSYTHENNIDNVNSYERLEFLGDAVLKLVASRSLYDKYPGKLEGELSKIRSVLVSDAIISEFAKRIALQEYIILGKNEERTGGRQRQSVIACAFEAILGAIYMKYGLKTAEEFLNSLWNEKIEEIERNSEKFNAKAALQEYTQGVSKTLPEYVLTGESGKEHDKIFEMSVYYNGKLLGRGSGHTKKDAQQKCAYEACIKLGIFEG